LVAHELKHALLVSTLTARDSSAIEGALGLIDEILETARADSAEGSAVPGECLTDALHRLQPVAASIESILPSRLPVPGQQLTIVLRNLISNALAAGANAIRIAASRSGSAWILTVDDDGVGLGGTTSVRRQGSGLGLAVCRRMVERWGGSLDLQRSSESGVRAILTLPTSGG
jgi:signal transduction histidine kinase